MLCHSKTFDPLITVGWASGTGMAGVAGALGYLLFASGLGLSNEVMFAALLPTAIIYW